MATADCAVLACDVAATFTVGGLGTAGGAVYKPDEEMVPQAAPEQPDPLTAQVTAVFALPVTVAANCCCADTINNAVVGDTETFTRLTTLIRAEADFVVSACDVTVTVTTDGFGTAEGAVYRPEVEIVPHPAPAQPDPLTLHETDVLEVPATCAVNCREADGASLAVVGEIVMLTPFPTVTSALADLLGSAAEVAVTDRNAGLGATAGAVYRPVELTVPQVLPAQPVPVIDHVTA